MPLTPQKSPITRKGGKQFFGLKCRRLSLLFFFLYCDRLTLVVAAAVDDYVVVAAAVGAGDRP